MRFNVSYIVGCLFLLCSCNAWALLVMPFMKEKNIIIQQKETVLDYHWYDIYSSYYKSGKEYTEVIHKIRMKICLHNKCVDISAPPMLYKAAISEDGVYIVGVSYSTDHEQLFIWNRRGQLIHKRKISCWNRHNCYAIDGPFVLWFDSGRDIILKQEGELLMMLIPNFSGNDFDNDDKGYWIYGLRVRGKAPVSTTGKTASPKPSQSRRSRNKACQAKPTAGTPQATA